MKLNELIIETFVLSSDISVKDEQGPGDLPGWDSLGHLNILMSLDKRLDGKASGLSELAKAMSVKKIISVLKNNNFYFNK